MRLIISPGARRDLRRLSRDAGERVSTAIDSLAADPRPPGYLLLRDYHPPTWRIRVGAWRVLYEINEAAALVTITGVRHRGKAY
jgi:mRNA interferase RelE/StbE